MYHCDCLLWLFHHHKAFLWTCQHDGIKILLCTICEPREFHSEKKAHWANVNLHWNYSESLLPQYTMWGIYCSKLMTSRQNTLIWTPSFLTLTRCISALSFQSVVLGSSNKGRTASDCKSTIHKVSNIALGRNCNSGNDDGLHKEIQPQTTPPPLMWVHSLPFCAEYHPGIYWIHF